MHSEELLRKSASSMRFSSSMGHARPACWFRASDGPASNRRRAAVASARSNNFCILDTFEIE